MATQDSGVSGGSVMKRPRRVERCCDFTDNGGDQQVPPAGQKCWQVLPAGQDFAACSDLCAGFDTIPTATWFKLHTRFALRRKSFPAERTYRKIADNV